jgi:uroporphyrinogen decarboxylase
MNDRQRFLATMHYQPRDRAPICDFGFWPETIELWHDQGLPDWVTGGHATARTNEFFGMDSYSGGPGVGVKLTPTFEEKVLEDRGDHEVVQQADGVRVLRAKFMSSIPVHEGHLLVDRASWNQHYKPRLDPSTPARYPRDWDAAMKIWTDPHRERICSIGGGSLYGWIRDWMGLENVSMVVYDDPAFFEEMVETVTNCVIETIRRPLEAGARFDCCSMWEDMCYNSGPLLSPQHFKQYLVPRYRRITDILHKHGIDVIWLDCDGKIDDLIPMWLDAGVNCMFPIEIGTWGADPVKYRRQYGKELLMMGGFDKHILARSTAEIDAEIHRLAPLVEEGGFIPFCDHRVPPDVPLSNYMHYLRTARKVWGRDTNLKPMGELVAAKV